MQAVLGRLNPRGGISENGHRPVKPSPWHMNQALRWLAHNRQGKPCEWPATGRRMRCRLHGSKCPGAPTGSANGRFTHGMRTKEMRRARALLRALAVESQGV